MNRMDRTFEQLRERGEKALVCFITAGDPDLETTEALVEAVVGAGADIVELGVPFSDPMADGPSIQASSLRALEAGATVRKVLGMVASIRRRCEAPIVLMTYTNPAQRYGIERFARDAAEAGADGVIMTDMPPDEAAQWKAAADEAGLATVFLLAPTSTRERIRLAAGMGSGFIYCVTRTGVTGTQREVPVDLKELVESIKQETSLPVLAGFGISSAEHVRQVAQYADGAVVGSALVNVIAEGGDSRRVVERATEFVRSLKEGTALQK